MAANVRLNIKSHWSWKASEHDSQSAKPLSYHLNGTHNTWIPKLKIPFVLSAEPARFGAAGAGWQSRHKGHDKPCSGHSTARRSAPSLFLRAWKMKHYIFLRGKILQTIFKTCYIAAMNGLSGYNQSPILNFGISLISFYDSRRCQC